MSGWFMLSNLLFAVTAAVAFVAGVLIALLFGSFANGGKGRRADELNHRIRALEADLRVAQRTAADARAECEALTVALAGSTGEAAALKEKIAGHDELVRKLRAEVQHECGKVARLRQELAERAEEMVRTHVQLRDVQNELGVSQVGSDVVIERIHRLERERDDLNALVDVMRRELTERARVPMSGDAVNRTRGECALVDC